MVWVGCITFSLLSLCFASTHTYIIIAMCIILYIYSTTHNYYVQYVCDFAPLTCRNEDDISERRRTTYSHLASYPHPVVMAAIGEKRFRDGTARIIEGLQCRELNKQLFFKLLDIFILELFPELQQPSQD